MPHTKTLGTGNKIVTLDSEVYRRKPVLTYVISGNVVGGFGETTAYAGVTTHEHIMWSKYNILICQNQWTWFFIAI